METAAMDSGARTNPSGRPARVPFDVTATRQSVFHALLQARDIYGGGAPSLIDGDGRVLSYDEIIRASFALGHALKHGTRAGENVGVLLPTGAGSALGFFALSAFGRVPTMLNFTAGESCLKSALATTQVRRIVTARRFIELAKLDALAAFLSERCELVYLEDVRARLSLRDKLAAITGSIAPKFVGARTAPGKPPSFSLPPEPKASPKALCSATKTFSPMWRRCVPISICTTATCCSTPCPLFTVLD